MRLYELYTNDGAMRTFGSQADVRRFRVDRKIARYRLDCIETAPLTKEIVVNMLNDGDGYVIKRQTIFNNL